jgi:hypothetical protein
MSSRCLDSSWCVLVITERATWDSTATGSSRGKVGRTGVFRLWVAEIAEGPRRFTGAAHRSGHKTEPVKGSVASPWWEGKSHITTSWVIRFPCTVCLGYEPISQRTGIQLLEIFLFAAVPKLTVSPYPASCPVGTRGHFRHKASTYGLG